MKQITAKDKILNILRHEGSIDNYRCIDQRLTTRLGAVIYKLIQEGKIELDQDKYGYIEETKNYRYTIKPPKKQEYFVNGVKVAQKYL